jgi:hypothetical protein
MPDGKSRAIWDEAAAGSTLKWQSWCGKKKLHFLNSWSFHYLWILTREIRTRIVRGLDDQKWWEDDSWEQYQWEKVAKELTNWRILAPIRPPSANLLSVFPAFSTFGTTFWKITLASNGRGQRGWIPQHLTQFILRIYHMAHRRNKNQNIQALAVNFDWLLRLFGGSKNRADNLLVGLNIEMWLRRSEPHLF